jgi:hypothetical protein
VWGIVIPHISFKFGDFGCAAWPHINPWWIPEYIITGAFAEFLVVQPGLHINP